MQETKNTKPEPHKTDLMNLQASHQVLLFFSLFSAFFYILFLLDFTNVSNWYLYITLLLIEFYIILQTVGLWWTTFYGSKNPRNHNYYELKKKIIKDNKIEGGVDIFITTYGEDLVTIAKTLQAAKNISIEHETYVLDDGKSPEVEKLANLLGIHYIARKNNLHYKAGNINHALGVSKGKYVAIFDADHTPKKPFLSETLPFFYDKKLAFVQTPQSLKNKDNLFSIGSSDAQQLFYELVCTGKNSFNSMFWVGTNAIFLREALANVGGVHTYTSEDMLTAYKIHQIGYNSIYIPDILATGLGPDNLAAYMKQQLRWASGGFMLFLNNPLFTKLSIDQKIQYLLTSTFYFCGFIILSLIIMPLLYIYFGIKPLNSGGYEWITHYVPYFLSQFIVILLLSGKISWQSYVLSMNSFPAHIIAFFKVFTNQKVTWEVTGTAGKDGFERVGFLWPHILLLLVSVLAIPLALVHPREIGTTGFAVLWTSINILSISTFIFLSYKNNPNLTNV